MAEKIFGRRRSCSLLRSLAKEDFYDLTNHQSRVKLRSTKALDYYMELCFVVRTSVVARGATEVRDASRTSGKGRVREEAYLLFKKRTARRRQMAARHPSLHPDPSV
jgi:hypothetical protein